MSRASSGAAASGRAGFILPVVVFMLFAISVAGATGFLVVNSEFALAKHSSDGAEALAVARAALQRFVAEQLGVVGDSVSYSIGDGLALVTTRKLAEIDDRNHLYYVRSEATVTDIFAPNTPARRVVAAYAYHRLRPLDHHAAVMIAANTIAVGNGGDVSGLNGSAPGDCDIGSAAPITGVIATITVTGASGDDIQGSPESEIWSGGASAMYDSVGIRWDVLTDPDFPVDFEDAPPPWSSIPADSFPVVRYNGWMGAGSAWSGRGLLIVNGVFDPYSDFSWNGIVLAGQVDDIIQGQIRGMFIGGLSGPNLYSTIDHRTDVTYYSCHVYDANRSLSYLELAENTIFEVS